MLVRLRRVQPLLALHVKAINNIPVYYSNNTQWAHFRVIIIILVIDVVVVVYVDGGAGDHPLGRSMVSHLFFSVIYVGLCA